MFDRTPTSIEMRTPAVLSAGVHVAALVAAVVNLNFFSRLPIEPEPVMVEFEAIAKKAAAPDIGVLPPQPKDAKVGPETTKAPPPQSADPIPAKEQAKPNLANIKPVAQAPEAPKADPVKPVDDLIALKPKEPEPPKVEKPPEPPKPQPEAKPAEPPKPTPPKPPPPKPNPNAAFDDLLKNIDPKQKVQTPEQQPKPVQEVTRQAPVAPQFSAVVTASEVEGVRQKIRPCWNFPGGVKGQDNLIVTLIVQMNQDGTPVKVDLKDTGRYNSDPTFRAAADSAQRAIMNPRCQPWPLSAEKYNSWRTITFNFDPRDY